MWIEEGFQGTIVKLFYSIKLKAHVPSLGLVEVKSESIEELPLSILPFNPSLWGWDKVVHGLKK